MIVGLCDTQIGGFSPILTNNTHRGIKKKLVKKSADFFGQEKSADFFVGGEIVWWDTSFREYCGAHAASSVFLILIHVLVLGAARRSLGVQTRPALEACVRSRGTREGERGCAGGRWV